MVQILLVGLGAGAAAALLFAAAVPSSLGAVFLFLLAPLPILIAALGWSHLAGLIAAGTAVAVVTILSGAFFFAVPVIAFGAWWLGYLALLARPSPDGAAEHLEWYPIGRIVLWAAVIGTLVVVAAVLNFSTDRQTLEATLRKSYERILGDQSVIDLLVAAVPPAAAVFSTVTNLINLWLAARIVSISGRLKRPWPDLAGWALPRALSSGLLAAAFAGTILPGLIGVFSGAFAASLLVAFAILGFAVLHAITRGLSSRGMVLAGTYAITFVIGWPVLLMSMLGLVETMFDIRGRIARKRGPPNLPA